MRNLFDFFPVPKSLSMHASGLAIYDDMVQFVTFTEHRPLRIKQFGEVAVPEDALDEGSVTNKKAFMEALVQLRKRTRQELVDVSIPEEKSYLFKTTVLGDNVKEITSNIELQISDNVPFKIAEVVFDFSFLGEPNKKGEREVMVSVLPRDVVAAYLEALHGADFTPVSFQVESQAVARAVVGRENKETVLVVNMKGDRAGFYIVSQQTVRFSSTADIYSGSALNIISEGSNSESKPQEGQEDFSILTREIKKILTYWETHDGSTAKSAISRVIIVPSTAQETQLSDFVAHNISVPVEIANVWKNAFSFDEVIPDMNREDSLRYAAAIGLALPQI